MIVLVLAALGLVLGSFVNALVWRMHERSLIWDKAFERTKDGQPKLQATERKKLRELSIWRGRSMCPHCRHVLAPKDLIPVVSWLTLRGRCRYCGTKFDDTPFAELLTPVAFVLSYLWWPTQIQGASLFQLVMWLAFVVAFVALTVYDLRWMLLPDVVVYPLIAIAVVEVGVLAFGFHEGWTEVVGAASGALVIAGLFYLLYVVSKGRWIGGGDVKLGVVLGLLVGGPMHGALLLFVASLAGVLFAVPQMLAGKAGRRAQIPFGPFLMLALFVVQLFGTSMVDWYERLLAG